MGGVGPAATAYAFDRLIRICQDEYGAVQDVDFPRVIVLNFPLEAMSELGFDDSPAVRRQLAKQLEIGFSTMARAGAEIAYMACNTLHNYEALLDKAGFQDINILDAAADYVRANLPQAQVAVISSAATRREKLYADRFAARQLQYVEIDDAEQTEVDNLILSAMGGQDLAAARQKLHDLCTAILKKADYVVLGCTELSLLADQCRQDSRRVIDAQEIAIRQLLKEARL